MEIKGKISYISKVTNRVWQDKTYPQQYILIEIPGYQDRVETIPFHINPKLQDRMDEYALGQEVTVHYEMKGNKYDNKNSAEPDSFLKLQTWRIDKMSAGVGVAQPQQGQGTQDHQWSQPSSQSGAADDLPF